MKIIYASNTGTTYEYAKLLSEKLKIEMVSFTEMKKVETNTPVIFMGWVFAGMISKLKKIRKTFPLIAVIAVGMTAPNEENNSKLITTNKVTEPFFYLQGGINYDRLKGFKKKILKMVANQVITENKPENKEAIEMFKHGGTFVSEKNLKEVYSYIQSKE